MEWRWNPPHPLLKISYHADVAKVQISSYEEKNSNFVFWNNEYFFIAVRMRGGFN